MATGYWDPNDPNNPNRGGGGGAGIILLLFLGIAIALAVVAGLIAVVATPILILLARWRGSKLTYGESLGPMFKSVFVLVAINAALFYLLQSYPGFFGESGWGLDLARGENALSLLIFGTDVSPQFAMLSAMHPPPLGIVGLLVALAAAQFLPLTAMAGMLRRELYWMRGGLGFALVASAVSVVGGLVLTILLLRLLAAIGTPMPISLVSFAFYAGIFALGTGLIGGFALGLLAAFFVRDIGFGETFRTGFVAMLAWAAPTALLFYYLRGADPLIYALLYANAPAGNEDPLIAVFVYLAIQVPGLFFASRAAGLWAMPRRRAITAFAAIAVVANLVGIALLGRMLG